MSASHLRIFSSAVQALASVGKEISLSVEPEGESCALILSAMNDSASSYASFRFESRFFGRGRPPRNGGGEACKLVARSLAPILRRATWRTGARSTSGVLKAVVRSEEREEAAVDGDEDEDGLRAPRVTFEIYQEDGIRRRWRLYYEVGVAEEPAVASEEDDRRIGCHPMQFGTIFDQVGTGTVECVVDDESLCMSSWASREEDGTTTQISIDKADLDVFEVSRDGRPCSFAFSGKEARAAVKFCGGGESGSSEVSDLIFEFSRAGKPISLRANSPSGCAMHFLLSTTGTSHST